MNKVRIVLVRNEAHNIVTVLSDQPDVEVHFADTDLEEAEGELTYLQLPNGTDLVVDHWAANVEVDGEVVEAFIEGTQVRERAEDAVREMTKRTRSLADPSRQSALKEQVFEANQRFESKPLVSEAGKCQFCGEPATVVLAGVSTCEECDSPPESE